MEFSRSRRARLREPCGGKIGSQTSSTRILEAPAPSAELELEYNDFGKNGQDELTLKMVLRNLSMKSMGQCSETNNKGRSRTCPFLSESG